MGLISPLTSLCSTCEQAMGWRSLGGTSFWHIRQSLQVTGAWHREKAKAGMKSRQGMGGGVSPTCGLSKL